MLQVSNVQVYDLDTKKIAEEMTSHEFASRRGMKEFSEGIWVDETQYEQIIKYYFENPIC